MATRPQLPQLPPKYIPARLVVRVTMVVLLIALAVLLAWQLRQPLTWIFIAMFISVALNRPIEFVTRRTKRRGMSIAIVYIGVLLIPVALASIMVPPIVREGTRLADKLPQYAEDVQEYVQENDRLKEIDDEYDITGKLREQAAKLPAKVGDAASALSSVASTIVSGVFAALTILILSIFISIDQKRAVEAFLRTQPAHRAERLRRTIERVEAAIGNYVAGVLFQATIAGVTTFIVLSILGVPFAAPLSVLVGLFDLIPLVGATIGAVVVGLVTVFTDFPTVTIIWVIYSIIYQQLENNIIQPQIQKRAVDIHPFVVIVSVLFGSALFGLLGALLAVPVAAAIQIVVREFVNFRRALGGDEPDPDQSGPELPLPQPLEPDEPLHPPRRRGRNRRLPKPATTP